MSRQPSPQLAKLVTGQRWSRHASRQSFVSVPAGALALWSEEFRNWCFSQLGPSAFPSSIAYNYTLRHVEQRIRRQPIRPFRQPAQRVARRAGAYLLDLGSSAIHITGRKWQTLTETAFPFQRPHTSKPLPPPLPATRNTHEILGPAFGLNEESAKAVAQWLELALRPGQPCPVLIITGEARDQAAGQIGSLIDPSTQPLYPLPHGQLELGWIAQFTRVMAITTCGALTEAKRKILAALSHGTLLTRLRQSDPAAQTPIVPICRPLIVTAESVPTIARGQIVIQVDRCENFNPAELLGALLNQMVRTLGNERTNAMTPGEPQPQQAEAIAIAAAVHTDRPIP